MIELPNFKKGALNVTVTNVNVWRSLMSHCWRGKTTDYIHLIWLKFHILG
jgi:hypothetical protein